MNRLKKISIWTGAAIGGVIGGTISLAGTVTHNSFLDHLGSDIIDSTILTASIAGNAASGTAHLVAGAVKRDSGHLTEAREDFSDVGHSILNNFKNNIHLILDNSGEILLGVKTKDGRRILNGAKTLGKAAAIGAITVGAIQVTPEASPQETDADDSPAAKSESSGD